MVTFKLGGGRGGGKGSGAGGTLFAFFFFFCFFGLGMFFEVMTIREFARNIGERAWKKTPCRIVTSAVTKTKSSKSPHRFAVQYEYEYNGQKYTSDVYKRGYKRSETYNDADKLVRKYPQGSQSICYINANNPSKAVLKQGSLLFGFVMLFPLIFVVIGGGGLYFIITGNAKEKKKEPIAAKVKGKKGKYVAGGFFLIFALAGAGMIYPLSILPITRTIDAESWAETPCKVLDARVRSHDSDDSTTYSVYILYEYTFGGQTYKSDRYSFVGGSSSGQKGKRRVVNQYKKAANPVCYVNPKHPYQAVLKRGFHVGLLLALLPLPFLLVGLVGFYYVVRGRGCFRTRGDAEWLPIGSASSHLVYPAAMAGGAESVVLKSSCSPLKKLLIGIGISLFWNGIVSVFVVSIINNFRHHDPEWGMALFSVPFVLIGLGMIAYVVYQFLALFNPRPRLELRPGQIRLGGAAQVQWSFSGNASRISELTIKLKGEEQATYRRGTKTHTDKRPFYEMELWKATDSISIASGQTGFVMPEDTMHSFEAENNKIIWSIDVHGDIAKWPDVKESFKIVIIPVAIR